MPVIAHKPYMVWLSSSTALTYSSPLSPSLALIQPLEPPCCSQKPHTCFKPLPELSSAWSLHHFDIHITHPLSFFKVFSQAYPGHLIYDCKLSSFQHLLQSLYSCPCSIFSTVLTIFIVYNLLTYYIYFLFPTSPLLECKLC